MTSAAKAIAKTIGGKRSMGTHAIADGEGTPRRADGATI
jgi:hypothetical protein